MGKPLFPSRLRLAWNKSQTGKRGSDSQRKGRREWSASVNTIREGFSQVIHQVLCARYAFAFRLRLRLDKIPTLCG